MAQVECETCKNVFPVNAARIGRARFCSKKCLYSREFPKEAREQISRRTKEGMASPELRERLSLAKQGFVPWMKGRKHTELSKFKNSLRHIGMNSGANHYRWSDKTSENVAIRNSPEYKIWRKAVFERDKYTCQICNIRGFKGLGKTVVLNADHIKPFALFPELRLDIGNGRTLCVPCHRKTDTWGVRVALQL